jgi:hypothetical protein
MQHLCINHGDSRPVGIIRCRMGENGRVEHYKSSFVEPMSAHDEEILDGIVARLAVENTGHIEERDGFERALEGIQLLERELGHKIGGE